MGDLGRHFGPSWGPKGVPKATLLVPSRPKVSKMTSRMGYQNKHEIVVGILLKNERFGGLRPSKSLQFFEKGKKSSKNNAKKDHKKYHTIDIWVRRGRIVES